MGCVTHNLCHRIIAFEVIRDCNLTVVLDCGLQAIFEKFSKQCCDQCVLIVGGKFWSTSKPHASAAAFLLWRDLRWEGVKRHGLG